MMNNFQLLEDIQTTYAEKYGFTVWVTDADGKILLQPAGNNELCNILLESESMHEKEKWEAEVRKVKSQNFPVFYDIFPGVYVMVHETIHEDGSRNYIWSGAIIEEGTEVLVADELNSLLNDKISGESLAENLPVLTNKLKAEWLAWMKKFGKLIELISSHRGANSEISRIQNELFQLAVKAENRMLEQLLADFSVQQPLFDFLGIAQNTGDGLYKITAVTGEGMESIKGREFSLGEGFLGRALLLNDFHIWQSIAKDPRLVFFTRHQLKPKDLFAYPISTIQEETILFFGGHFSKNQITDTERELVKTFAYTMEAHAIIHDLQQQNEQQVQRLSSLSEISSLMASSQDVTKLVYLLVDITLNLIDGSFSCVILKDAKKKRVKVISRGSPPADFKSYVKEVASYYLSDEAATDEGKMDKPVISNATRGVPVIECLLSNGKEVQAVLCAGLGEERGDVRDEHRKFLQTLSIIAGISLQMMNKEEESSEEHQVYLLHRAVSQFDEEKYEISKEASRMASSYVMHLGLDVEVMKDIIYACRLSYYEPDFIHETLPDRKVDIIIQEGNALMKQDHPVEWEECSVGGQVYGLVWSYAENKNLQHIPSSIKDKPLVQNFMSAIQASAVMEEEISPDEEIVKDEKLHSVASSIKEMDLSPREQEVLDLLVKGLNNKEIAQELFISGHTVKNHVTRIFQKLEVPDRAHAISKVYRHKYKPG